MILTKTSLKPVGQALLRLGWAPALVLVVHKISLVLTDGWYWWDEPVHALGGVAIALMAHTLVSLAQEHGHMPRLPVWFHALFVCFAVMFAGVVWEWYEWFVWAYINPELNLTLSDTLKDLANDLAGGLLFVIGWILTAPAVDKRAP